MNRFLAIPILGFTFALFGNPQDPNVAAGAVTLQKMDANTLHITASDKAVIHWNEFSISPGELTRFLQPSSDAAVLNRVTGGHMSQLMGTLEANGKVYLINPSGVIVGKDSVINTASFLASTLDILDADFVSNSEILFKGDANSPITNYGQINAWDGDVILLGYTVDNQGSLQAPKGTVAMGAGQEIVLKPTGERLFIRLKAPAEKADTGITHEGKIDALRAELKADGNAYSMAINYKGQTDATRIENRNGEVFLFAEEGFVSVSGPISAGNGEVRILGDQVVLRDGARIDVSGGGTVLVGGGYQGKNPEILNASITLIEKGASIHADGRDGGDGGKVIVWSDAGTGFHGEISAQGGPNGGDGGLVELSSKGLLEIDPEGKVNTAAPFGKGGTLLFDPCAVTIDETPADTGFVINVGIAPCNHDFDFGVNPTSNIKASTLTGALGTNNVCINASTTGMVGGTGSITVISPVIWFASNTLTLVATDAGSTIDIQAAVDVTAAFGVGVDAISVNAPTVNIGRSDHTLMALSSLSSNSGTISVNAATALNIYGGGAGFAGEIRGYGVAEVAVTGGGTILLQPSDSLGSSASIAAPGNISIGTMLTPMGAVSLGTTTALAISEIQRSAAAGNLTIYCADITMQGGANPSAKPTINGDNTLIRTGTLAMNGGSMAGNLIQGGASLNITTTTAGANSCFLEGGDIAASSSSFSSSNITLSVAGNFHAIGSGGASLMPELTGVNGNDLVNVTIGGDLLLQGNVELAGIASGFGPVTVTLTGQNGTGNCTLTGGTGDVAFAVIGTLFGGSTTCTIAGDYILDGGNSCAVIGSAFGSGTGNTTLTGKDYSIMGGPGSPIFLGFLGTGITVGGGSNLPPMGPLPNGIISITSTGPNGITLTGGPGNDMRALIGNSGIFDTDTIDFTLTNPSANLTLNGSPTAASGSGATIFTAGGGYIHDPVGNDIILAGTAGNPAVITVAGGGTGDILLIAGRTISLNEFSAITNDSTGGITLVTDNNNPSPPSVGTNAFFITEAGSAIDGYTTGMGPLRIFASTQSNVTVGGTLNGASFTKGPELVDTDQELWFVYFGDANSTFVNPLAPMFTLFYKGVIASGAFEKVFLTEFTPASTEALYSWRVHFAYNTISYIPTWVRFNQTAYVEAPADMSYEIAHEQYKNYRTLKLDQL